MCFHYTTLSLCHSKEACSCCNVFGQQIEEGLIPINILSISLAQSRSQEISEMVLVEEIGRGSHTSLHYGGGHVGSVFMDGQVKAIGLNLDVCSFTPNGMSDVSQATSSTHATTIRKPSDSDSKSDPKSKNHDKSCERISDARAHLGKTGAAGALIGRMYYIFGGLMKETRYHLRLDEDLSERYTNTVTVLDMDSLQWQPVAVTGTPPSPRDKFVLFARGTAIYVFGGYGPRCPNTVLHEEGQDCIPDASRTVQVLNTCYDAFESLYWNNSLHMLQTFTGKPDCNWTDVETSGPIPVPRAGSSSTILDHRAFIFGGRYGRSRRNDIHCLDLNKNKWSGELPVQGHIPSGRSWATLSASASGMLVLCGGYDNRKRSLRDIHILHPDLLMWQEVNTSQSGVRLETRHWHSACVVENDIYILGGFVADLRDPWRSVNRTTVARVRMAPLSLRHLCLLQVACQPVRPLIAERLPLSLRLALEALPPHCSKR